MSFLHKPVSVKCRVK